MATLNSAIQALVDNLHGKMTGNDPLTAEEQTLVASAIEKLSNHTGWEQALVAVAEEHLDAATQALSQTLTTATGALTSAETDINTARDSMQSQNANLALIPQVSSDVQTALSNFSQTSTAELTSNLAGMPRPVFGINKIETAGTGGTNQRSSSIFAVYDSSGESFIVRPSHSVSNNGSEYNRLEYLKLPNDGSGKEVIGSHFIHNSTFYATPTTYIYQKGANAILPLATKADNSDIAYDVVYSTQDSASANEADYGGIYCRNSGAVTMTKPKLNIDAEDQWGISTVTSHQWSDVAVLYDNAKHCMVMVDDGTSLLVEKYRDGNIVTSTSIADSAALQTYVDSGDFTVVKFIIHTLQWPSCIARFNGSATNTSVSANVDCYGFYGKLGSELKMGGSLHSAHYRFTAEQRLEPVNYFFANSNNAYRYHGSYGTDAGKGEVRVSIADMQGNTLGIYTYHSKADSFGQMAGYMASALMCMNPYSHVGIINETAAYQSTTAYYGIARTCKAF
jgi:hypothetical protein